MFCTALKLISQMTKKKQNQELQVNLAWNKISYKIKNYGY